MNVTNDIFAEKLHDIEDRVSQNEIAAEMAASEDATLTKKAI